MSKKQNYTLEKHIYVEVRSGAFRFQVKVHPLKDSATFSTEKEGTIWARRRKLEFLEARDGVAKAVYPSAFVHLSPVGHPSPVGYPSPVGIAFANSLASPANIKLSDVFDWFEKDELPKLAGKDTEASRLALLRKCFGERTIGELDKQVLSKWENDRLAGKYGSGRAPNRTAAMTARNDEQPLTKHQRYYRKNSKAKNPRTKLPKQPIYPVSTQSVRHELVLFRRAVTKYLKNENLWPTWGGWWGSQELMQRELPKAADPRSRRVTDEELVEIFSTTENKTVKAAILFAVLTSLRRGKSFL